MQDREKEIEGDLQTLHEKLTSKNEQIKEKRAQLAQIEAIKTQQMGKKNLETMYGSGAKTFLSL